MNLENPQNHKEILRVSLASMAEQQFLKTLIFLQVCKSYKIE